MDREDELQPSIEGGEQRFETTPEQATAMGGGPKPGTFNRKRALMALCVSFGVVICGGLVLNTLNEGKKKAEASEADASRAGSRADREFLSALQNKAVRERLAEQAELPPGGTPAQEKENAPEPLLPPVSVSYGAPQNAEAAHRPVPPAPPPPAQYRQGGGQQPQEQAHFKSSLVPQVQGRQFAQAQAPQTPEPARADSAAAEYFNGVPQARAPAPYGYGSQASDYASQNGQENKQAFYDSSGGGDVFNGRYLGDNSLWTGTVIPGVLETAVNTDLPGNVLARVTQNIYDSRTGRNLLIPQGTLLAARYNSSVSYAQNRVQIVWDSLIRPDGYRVDLGGANGVDRAGMSGTAAKSDEHWFEYLKAAGIVTLFSVANSKMTEESAKRAEGEKAAGIAEANSAVVNQLSGNLSGRAMNIQPTLTVENGTRINIMLNKTLYLPPVKNGPQNQ
jgi:type IV secretory pathway VirB10-like protein